VTLTSQAGDHDQGQRARHGGRGDYFRVVDPNAAVVKVEITGSDFAHRADDVAQRARQSALDELLSQRDVINQKLQEIMTSRPSRGASRSRASRRRKCRCPQHETRNGQQAEPNRERRAKVVNAQGEFEAAEKMVQPPR